MCCPSDSVVADDATQYHSSQISQSTCVQCYLPAIHGDDDCFVLFVNLYIIDRLESVL